jgi:membrane glycosyltransferase
MVPALRGSYEEIPPALTDLAVRDRRWCQGNLQHAAVLAARGLHPVSRLHLLTGIGSYVTAPLWLLFLVVGIFGALEARFIRPAYFPSGPSLFPDWPVVDPVRAMWLFIGTMSLLLAPKLLAWFLLLLNREDRRGVGGAARSFLGVLLETLVAGLLAPVTMLTQSVDVISILLGRDSGWQPQRRHDGKLPLREVMRLYWRHTAFGVLLAIASWLVSPFLALWMLPVTLGLALAVPLVALTARPAGLLRRMGLLAVPEEVEVPPVLARASAIRQMLMVDAEDLEAVHRLAAKPELLKVHRQMLPPPRRPRLDPVDPVLLVAMVKAQEARDLSEALASLSRAEKAALLADATGVERLVGLAAREADSLRSLSTQPTAGTGAKYMPG